MSVSQPIRKSGLYRSPPAASMHPQAEPRTSVSDTSASGAATGILELHAQDSCELHIDCVAMSYLLQFRDSREARRSADFSGEQSLSGKHASASHIDPYHVQQGFARTI